MTERKSTFFRDGISRIDFVLVQKKVKSEALRLQNYRFVANLRKIGLQVEREKGVKYEDYIFIKLHTPDDVLKQIADIHGVALTFEKDRTIPPLNKRWWVFKTPITRKINLQDPLFARVSESVRGEPNRTYTTSERIMLTYFILIRTKYGSLPDEYGLLNLLANKNFEDAYPLHDGKWEWNTSGPLNDRQVLCQFWSNWNCFFKNQPIHLIYKYYGSEIAFHYAWSEFYMMMLLPVAILGLLVFIISILRMFFDDSEKIRVDEVCDSNLDLCPTCVHAMCEPEKMSHFCRDAMITYVMDNNLSIAFALIITVWAVFLVMWQRDEYRYLYRWNLINVQPDIDELPEYKQKTKNYIRVNQYTGAKENYYPLSLHLRQYGISGLFCFVSILVILVTLLGIRASVYFIRYTMYISQIGIMEDYGNLLLTIYSGLACVICMNLYTPVVTRVSLFLTDKEVHRTRNSYLNSYILKSFVMSFFNTYTALFYKAFLKDISYTHPGDHETYDRIYGMATEVCPPSLGCTASLSIQLIVFMFKNYFMTILKKSNIIPLLWRYVKIRLDKVQTHKKIGTQQHIPQWELDFELMKPTEMFFLTSFTSLMLEFGTVIFFVAALPLLPLLALFNNLIEMRLSSITLTRRIRRNVPMRVHGLGAWNIVMMIITRLSFVISGCVIAFTSNFVHRVNYIVHTGTLEGFLHDSVSGFLVDDFKPILKEHVWRKYPNMTVCYFSGLRNCFNDTNKYDYSDRHHKMLSLELVCLVVFVHAAFFLTHLIPLIIPPEPATIRQCLQYDDYQMHLKTLKDIRRHEDIENRLKLTF